ncbi:DUF3971 multi-domain protein [Sulfitobacter noctilucicola]|uniref:YhdP central domain-containing protein n=1 Tax=Sulfitobacter noctilucicola TaxID=1342301 RepID=A0A7W6MBE0_9RHOB|nr:DUF3971 domain-containing protein [Sulfitobacter noctilucicola]KIN66327.1 DUF3971 multi-domain protein [Sulfitobacter noctilucicola]MBB4175677.1 hypothetical protein [Sulfitobacter noctilucicola]
MSDTSRSSSRTPKARHVGKGVMWLLNLALGLTTVGVLSIAGAVVYLKNNPVTAPVWVQSRIEARLEQVLPEARITFGEMAFVMEDNWTPRVRLRDVVVQSLDGQELLHFNEFRATLASGPLLQRQFQPRDLSLSGMVATLRRSADGSFFLQSGLSGLSGNRQAATLPQLVGQVDTLLLSPAMSALREVDLRALTLRYEDVRADRVWTMDGGRLRLIRDGENLTISADLAVLDGGAGVATLAANYTSRIGETEAEFGVNFDGVAAGDIAAQGPAFAWLGVLQAPISGSVRSGFTPQGRFAPLAASLNISEGVVQPNAATEPIPFEEARSYFNYDPEARFLQFDALSVRSKWISGEAAGSAALGLDAQGSTLTDLVGQINLSGLRANPADLYEAPVELAGVDLDFRLTLDPFKLTLGRAQLSDQGKTAILNGVVEADPKGWRLALDARMDAIERDRLLTLWPERAAPGTRDWVATNLKAGQVSNIDLALRRAPDMTPQTYLAFDFEEGDVRYVKTLPNITDAQGHFSLAENRLVVSVDKGDVIPPQGGAIEMSGSSFIIPDVRAKDGTPAVVRLKTRSSVTAALSLLNMPPLSVMDKANLPEALAGGEAELEGTLAMTLRKGQRIKVDYHVNGGLRRLNSDVLVKGRKIEADRLELRADNKAFRLEGPASLDGLPVNVSYTQPVGKGAGPAKLLADLELSERTLDRFGVALPPGTVSGSGKAEVEITIAKGKPPQLKLQSDLRGIRVSVPQVSWSKPASRAGALALSIELGSVPKVESLSFSAPGLAANGSVTLGANAALERVRFDSVKVGDWLDVPLDLIGRGKGRPVQVVLRGGTLDLRRAEFGDSKPNPAAPPMEVALNRLQITDTIALTGIKGRFNTAKGLDGNFQAQLNGAVPVQGRLLPQSGRSAVRLQSDDAGAVLRAAGLLKQVVGGSLSLVLLPVGSGGAFDGKLDVGGVAIKDAPGIAALLNAVSVVGLVNELNGDGIYFDEVEARFRLTPNRLTLTEASAVGASMGLSMDGTYVLNTGQIAMQGVISPVYLLNGIGSLFTRKGEGLIGFNYALSGLAKEPKVSVNPLSALTPAMFREIFRAPPPDLPEVDGITESTLPSEPQNTERPVARTFEGR